MSSTESTMEKTVKTNISEDSFTRLIEKLHDNNYGELTNTNNTDFDDPNVIEEELNFNHESSPSPQPQPDLMMTINNQEEDNCQDFQEWTSVLDVNTNHCTLLSDHVSSSERTEKVEEASEKTTKITKRKSSSTKKKSAEHISVDGDTNNNNNDGIVSISKLKSVYCPTTQLEESSAINNNNNSVESRVFAKVCVANLRRSFGDLTNINQTLEEVGPRTHEKRPNSIGACNNNNAFINSSSVVEKWRSKSLVDLESSCSGVSVLLLKSSFSKFDELSRKNSVQQKKEQTTDSKEEKICKSCEKQVFLVELIKAEKASWHRNCFRCSQCNKQLSVDTYSSHEGKLYCKPHFKQLFQPKAVFALDDESSGGGGVGGAEKPEVIIRESQPVQLPPDVVRACEKTSSGLEEIQVDQVKAKFQMFENYKQPEVKGGGVDDIPTVKRSASVLARLARYEKGKEGDIGGVPNDELHGELEDGSVSEEEEEDDNEVVRCEMRRKLKNPAAAMAELLQCKQMEEIRGKWEEGMNSNKEELSESRRNEMAKFRTRLCQGKSNQLKELYEKSLTEETASSKVLELDELRLEKAKRLREMFEKGEVVNDEEEEEEEKKSQVEKDMAVFESGVAKQSRSLFQEMDHNLAKNGPTVFSKTTPDVLSPVKKLNKSAYESDKEIVRCTDKVDPLLVVASAEDLSKKFKFFESYEKQLEESQRNEKKTFRITPPREICDKKEEDEEVYRDPGIVRSCDKDDTDLIIQKSRTTSKMLNVFRQLEEQPDVVVAPRPLKQFTPPREPARLIPDDDKDEEEEEEDQESDYEEEEDVQEEMSSKDAFLKEVGSLARARSLRARFERWEAEENAKNEDGGRSRTPLLPSVGVSEQDEESIESARNLRAKFEQIQLVQAERQAKAEQRVVRRFVELQIGQQQAGGGGCNSLEMSDSCAYCEKKVYAMEKLEANSKTYHKNCFRCSVCKSIMRMDSFTFHHGALYCKNHFKQLFKIKGNYDEGFGHETQKQIWAKKNAEKENQ